MYIFSTDFNKSFQKLFHKSVQWQQI